MKNAEFKELEGLTITEIEKCEVFDGDGLIFRTADGREYLMGYRQDCCASVGLDDINGELDWLLNSPVLRAEENSSEDEPPKVERASEPESETWTFYRIQTAKGLVVIRWHGESNGYYSESPSFQRSK